VTDPRRELCAALGKLPSGLFILTARRGDQETGMLTSWVQQCSFDPPHLTLALKRGRPILDWLEAGSDFSLNILDDCQTDVVAHFGRGFALDQPAFEDVEIDRDQTGAPILKEALAYLQCRVAGRQQVGDHELLVALILDGRILNDGQPMVHIRKSGAHY
jgi:flavin reductase (DIM6/NTAB) family NADH-FMN oxidoreductase RutF